MNKGWMLGLALGGALGCGEVDEPIVDEAGDEAGDSFLVDGKADSAGVVDGSGEACGVLRLASEATQEILDDDVGLDRRAAANIAAWRLGADGQAGTSDDRRFQSLEALDAVSHVGPSAFRKLLRHVAANDLACDRLDLQFLSVSDWHGQLDPLATPTGPVGGAAQLAAYFARDRAANPATLTLTAGDAFGATPPLASFFDEIPAVLAMNLMGFDADSLGNHNFDRGVDHLSQMIEMAEYPFLSSNLTRLDRNLECPSKPRGRCVEPFKIFTFSGVKVAVIGATNPDAQTLVKPGSFGTIEITDPVAALNRARAQAARKGATVFVAMVHMGATGTDPSGSPTGPLMDLARGLQGFDVVLGDHTNVRLTQTINDALVVESLSSGGTYARVQAQYDFATRRVAAKSVEHVTPVPAADLPPDAAVEAALAPYRQQLAVAFDGTIATATGLFQRGNNVERLREMPIGNLVADSMRVHYGTQLGFTNGGGLRASIPSSYLPANQSLRRTAPPYPVGPPFDVVIGDVYAVLPFGNSVVTRTVTGAQLWAMLEHSVSALPAANGRFGQISGFRFEFDSTRMPGARVLSVELDGGTPIAPDQTAYTLATSDFIDQGGDGYTMLLNGDGVSREKMAEVLLGHIRALATLEAITDGRIRDQATP